MSGHSHYATIHRQKDLKDAQKGKIFSKLGREITIAAKAGGSSDPASNYKLRMAIEHARASNMPKDNIERAISKGLGGESLEEVVYEGFAPNGISVIVEAQTDNRNRMAQEIKNVFERGGGSLGGPGSVAFNFEARGLIIVQKDVDYENQIMTLIDLGIEDFIETPDSVEIYTAVDKTNEIKTALESKGIKVLSFELIKRPKNTVTITSSTDAKKVMDFLERLEELDDVSNVYANLEVPDEVLKLIGV